MAELIKVPLQYPIAIAGKTVSELTLQRPKSKHFWGMDQVKGEQQKLDALIASIAGGAISEIGELDIVDRMAVMEALTPFLDSQVKPTASE
jgi:hypothetical protein